MWTIRRPGSTLRVPPAGNKLHLKGSNRSEVQWQSAHLMLAFLAMQLNVVLDTCQTVSTLEYCAPHVSSTDHRIFFFIPSRNPNLKHPLHVLSI